MPAERFVWEELLSVPWIRTGDHINLCEERARNLAVRARARNPALHGQRFVHLMNSQVNLAQSSKGRCGSLRMSHIHRQTAATLLAGDLRDVNGYVRSDRNPADRASRDRRG